MPGISTDYKVDFVHKDVIAETALRLRELAGNENLAYFDIVDFVERVLRPEARRPFNLNLIKTALGETPAYVDFNPLTLHVDDEVWQDARDGDPMARFIIAHEIGHLILHDHRAKAFSNDPAERIQYAQPEYSTEWQAHTFAYYFLVPDRIAAAFNDIHQLAAACGITKEIARERIAMSPNLARRHSAREAGFCSHCGNFSLSPSGVCLSNACSHK